MQATNIDRQQATRLARDFMSKNFSKKRTRQAYQTVPLNSVETGQSLLHAFNVEGGGFVIVAGDDCAPAILGYSETSVIDPSDLPDGLKELFAQYQAEMQLMKNSGLRAATYENLGAEIPSMLECKWGQRGPYNYMCPKYLYKRNGKKSMTLSLTGCPATAMSQILFYHKYPAAIKELPGEYWNAKKETYVPKPDVSKTLEWDKMLPTYGTRDNKIQGTQEQKNAVAKLMRLVGQSVTMQYSPQSSGTWASSVESSFVNYFDYDASTIRYVQRRDYSYEDWIKVIYQEIANKRPVYYRGASNTGGHAFVIDGYSHEDFFYINWGWLGSSDGSFRLALCNPGKKYEGGGTGDAGYTGHQGAIIGIQPASTPQQTERPLEGYNKWYGKYSYERESSDQDFDITESISQSVRNLSHATDAFDYGFVVKDATGKEVQKRLPLNDKYRNLYVKPGSFEKFDEAPLEVGANLGDGTYTLQFLYRYGANGEWKPFHPYYQVVFKIKGNQLLFDCRPDWLTVTMKKTYQGEDEEDDDYTNYKVEVTLRNTSTDKTFSRTIRLGRETKWKNLERYGFAAMVEPGQEITFDMDYKTKYPNSKLYLLSYEDCVPLREGMATGTEYKVENVTFAGQCNLEADLKLQADKSYVLKADDSYEVTYTLKNNGTGEFYGYVELVDSVGTKGSSEFDDEDVEYEGETITLKAGESKELKMTIYDDGDNTVVHKVSLVRYDNDDLPITLYESKPFSIEPVYNLTCNLSVTPTEEIDNELADYLIKGNQVTVSGKITNPEETAFVGSLVLKRYVIDYSEDPEQDEEGNDIIDPDKTYTKEVTIPAKGSIDYSQVVDLQNLVKDKDYSVTIEFEMLSVNKSTEKEIQLVYSDSYLLNDGTLSSISGISVPRCQSEAIYDLQGRRINGLPIQKGIYIKGNRKVVLK